MRNIRQYILDRNHEQSDIFSSADARGQRRMWRAQHPTEILAFKCMDGRLNLPIMTETPPGIIQPFRNIGGRFDLGWPFLGETVKDAVDYGVSRGRASLVFVTYHFSKGDTHRGCAGFEYDTNAARASAFELQAQFERVFGQRRRVVYPIVVGIETDEDALVFHGRGAETLNVASMAQATIEDLEERSAKLYPDMTSSMRSDLLELIRGNQRHVCEIRQTHRAPIDLEHREQVITVGRGLGWLHLPNVALIVGPYSHSWPSAVETAAKIVRGNLEAGRISRDAGILLLVSALTRDEKGSAGWNVAVEKAKYLRHVAREVIENSQPKLAERLVTLTGVVDAQTWLLHEISDDRQVIALPHQATIEESLSVQP